MLRVLICEDEPMFVRLLLAALEECETALEHRVCCSAQELLPAYHEQPDTSLILLDLHLTGDDGMALAHTLRDEGYAGAIAFVTVDPDFVYDGYSVAAEGYFLKPARPVQLSRLIDGISRRMSGERYLVISRGGVTRRIPAGRLLYLEICGKQVAYHLPGECLSQTGKLDDVMPKLPAELFVRCHRSYAVNIRQVVRVQRYLLTLRDGTELPVSKAYSASVREAFSRKNPTESHP